MTLSPLFNVNILRCAAHLSASATLFIRNSGSVVGWGSLVACPPACPQSASPVPVTKSSTSCCSQLSVSCSLAGASVNSSTVMGSVMLSRCDAAVTRICIVLV